jgi:hypothetical protein
VIELIFTIDYEIYGNGEGSLKELVYEPAEKLKAIFRKWKARFVAFVEVAELEIIEAKGTDSAIDLVKQQIKNFLEEGFEIGLHLHPQWYNGRYENGKWALDYSEYNLCKLPRDRIVEITDRSLAHLRDAVGIAKFTPLSFRAGNWLFQPTQPAAKVLAARGIRIDSSVFKGGRQHQHNLDYRRALRNGYYWKFAEQVDVPDTKGTLIEIPIYTQMVPFWKMLTSKRVSLQQRASSTAQTGKERLYRFLDFVRFYHPLKFDFCRMTMDEFMPMIDTLIEEDKYDPMSFRPIVAIGHTKDLVDFETVESLLSYLAQKGITISTFQDIHYRCE